MSKLILPSWQLTAGDRVRADVPKLFVGCRRRGALAKPVILVLAALPAIAAMLLVSPLLARTEVPQGAALPTDVLELDYERHELRTVQLGVTETLASERTEHLRVSDGAATYYVIESGLESPEIHFEVGEDRMLQMAAFVKETGVLSLPADAFPARPGEPEYTRHSLEATLNGASSRISWTDQDSTDAFVPPIISELESKLRSLIDSAPNN